MNEDNIRKMRGLWFSILTLLITCAFLGCHPVIPVHIPDIPLAAEDPFVNPLPETINVSTHTDLENYEFICRFYQQRTFKPLWMVNVSPAAKDSLIACIKSMRYYGLRPVDYHLEELELLKDKTDNASTERKEALLTDSFLLLAHDLKYSRTDHTNELSDSLKIQLMEQAGIHPFSRSILELQQPFHMEYHLLKKELFKLLNKSDSIRQSFIYSGVTNDSVNLHYALSQLEINMERWRAELPELGERYIWINIPSFELKVIDHGLVIFQSRIIVGKKKTPTPVLTSTIDCFTLFPYWTVPRKIAVNEFLPRIKKDTSFLSSNRFTVLDRKGKIMNDSIQDWSRYNANNFPFTLRQAEGPENSMGIIKFIFENPYAVFLHDTNTKSFYKKEVRAFSHGCIRMEKAMELAYLFAPDKAKLSSLLEKKIRNTVTLTKPMTIYIRYYTYSFNVEEITYLPDIYSLNAIPNKNPTQEMKGL